MIDVLIADDQTLLRDALETILTLEEDIRVVATARNGHEAYELVRALAPQVILMDIRMPGESGLACTKRIKKDFPAANIVILTTYAEEDQIVDALLSGASGFLLKDMSGEKVIQSIRNAAKGEMILPFQIAAKLAHRLSMLSKSSGSPFDTGRLRKERLAFTDRETKIIQLLIEGRSNREIADTFFMSEGTVKNYITVIYGKIGINERPKAIQFFKERLQTDPVLS